MTRTANEDTAMINVTHEQIDTLQCHAAGLLSVTDLALRLHSEGINIVEIKDPVSTLYAEMFYSVEARHVGTSGIASSEFMYVLSRPKEDSELEYAIVVVRVGGENHIKRM